MARTHLEAIVERTGRWRRGLALRFPERHVYVRSHDGVRGLVLSTGMQLGLIAGGSAVLVWTLAATVALTLAGFQARDQGHADLAQRLALQQTVVVREARLIAAAQGLARARAERLRMILRAAGVDPSAAGSGGKDDTGLIQGSQPGDLAGALGVDEDLARLIQQAARAAGQARDLGRASMGLPIGRPTPLPARPNDFGMRVDPFTGRLTFHPGLDFPAPRMTPVYATAEGVVTYAGLRNGYGATVEVDHGNGFFTRFAHLAAIVVKAGQRVEPHTQLGAVGSTGRSTGPHLHYEIWRNGRPQDPGPYLRVGDYVEAAG